jgi:hypothetical protein
VTQPMCIAYAIVITLAGLSLGKAANAQARTTFPGGVPSNIGAEKTALLKLRSAVDSAGHTVIRSANGRTRWHSLLQPSLSCNSSDLEKPLPSDTAGMTLHSEPDSLVMGRSGDWAVELGRLETIGAGAHRPAGRYMRSWERRDDSWIPVAVCSTQG